MEAKLQALKVVDLKKLLQDANLPVSGAKADLVKRLLENPEAASSIGGGNETEEDLIGDVAEEAPVDAASVPPTSTSTDAAPPPPATTAQKEANGSASAHTSTTAEASALQPVKDEATLRAETIAELEKRKARAQRWGTSTKEIDEQLEQIAKHGVQSSDANVSLSTLDGELKTKGRKEVRDEKRAAQKEARGQQRQQRANLTEEEKNAQRARHEADAEAKRKRAEKYGVASEGKKAVEAPVPLDPVEEEKKRKRLERFGGATSGAQPEEKRVKT